MKHVPWIPLSAASALAIGLVAFALASSATAEPEIGPPPGPPPHDGPRPPHGPHHPPHDPLRRALDADGDHVISSEEIANAASALKSLDRNGDGKLDREEMRPPMPPGMQRRPGPPEGRRGPPPEGSEGRGDFRGPPGPDGPRPEGPKPEMFVDRLMEFDADSDGKLDRSELMAAAEMMTAKRREHMEKMGRWMGERRQPAPPSP
jgi:hypothetical protein